MNIRMFDGLLLFLLFMWTSADTASGTERTGGSQVNANERRLNIQSRFKACVNLGGKCIKKKKDCPSGLPLETEPGRPYCSKRQRCCYPGPSCNLVWNYNEHRPLIMIRETKTIVPPVDTTISNDPNRIPLGVKLVFACAGRSNVFNHIEGVHTKLHGECVAEDQFKVCVNNSPVYLDLSDLACRKKLFPSFIKQDNGTSDDNGCDELGGELYTQGYTYGDYHEFKDLEIDVCFTEENEKTLCTSPNLSGNETDYRAEELQERYTRGKMRTGPECSICPLTTSLCDKMGDDFGVVPYCLPDKDTAKCSGEIFSGLCLDNSCKCCVPKNVYEICNDRNNFPECSVIVEKESLKGRCTAYQITNSVAMGSSGFCTNPRECWVPEKCPNPCFSSKHICGDCVDAAEALAFTKYARGDPATTGDPNTVFYVPGNNPMKYSNNAGIGVCKMLRGVKTFQCTQFSDSRSWEKCIEKGSCKGESELKYPGHLNKDRITGDNCSFPKK